MLEDKATFATPRYFCASIRFIKSSTISNSPYSPISVESL